MALSNKSDQLPGMEPTSGEIDRLYIRVFLSYSLIFPYMHITASNQTAIRETWLQMTK